MRPLSRSARLLSNWKVSAVSRVDEPGLLRCVLILSSLDVLKVEAKNGEDAVLGRCFPAVLGLEAQARAQRFAANPASLVTASGGAAVGPALSLRAAVEGVRRMPP